MKNCGTAVAWASFLLSETTCQSAACSDVCNLIQMTEQIDGLSKREFDKMAGYF